MPNKISKRRFLREVRKHPLFWVLTMIWTILTALSVLPILLPPEKARNFSLYPYLPRWDWHIAVIGFLIIALCGLFESYYHFYKHKTLEIEDLGIELHEAKKTAADKSARYLRRSNEIVELREEITQTQARLEQKDKELSILTGQMQIVPNPKRKYFGDKLEQLTLLEKNILHYLVRTGASGDNAGYEAAADCGVNVIDDPRRSIRHKTNLIRLSSFGQEINPEFKEMLESWASGYVVRFIRQVWAEQGKKVIYKFAVRASEKPLVNLKVSLEELRPQWLDGLREYAPTFPVRLYPQDGCTVSPHDTEFFDMFDSWESNGELLMSIYSITVGEPPNDPWELRIMATWLDGSLSAGVKVTRQDKALKVELVN